MSLRKPARGLPPSVRLASVPERPELLPPDAQLLRQIEWHLARNLKLSKHLQQHAERLGLS